MKHKPQDLCRASATSLVPVFMSPAFPGDPSSTMPKATTPRQARRHNPLEDDIVATGTLRSKAPKRKSKDAEGEEENYIDSKASRNILRIGRELIEENDVAPPRPPTEPDAFGFDSRFDQVEADDDAFPDEETWGDEGDEEEIVEEIEVDDLDTFNKFLPTEEDPLLKHGWGGQDTLEPRGGPTNLADLIMAKIAAHEAGDDRRQIDEPIEEDYELPPKVIEVYTKYVALLVNLRPQKLTEFQNRHDPIQIQVRQATQALQDSTNDTQLGADLGGHRARPMDA